MKKSFMVLSAVLTGLALETSAAVVNISPGTTAAVTQSSEIGYPAANALNRNYGDFTHTAAEATDNWWQLDLGTLVPIERVVLFNRGDGCCGYRLRDISISLYDGSHQLLVESPRLNLNGSLGSPATLSFTNEAPLWARYVKVTRTATGAAGNHDANTLSLGEVEIYANNLAQGQPASQSSTYPGYPAENAVNGHPGNFTHTTAEATPNWWQVDLGANFRLDSVLLLNRPDCCGGRLRDLTLTVQDDVLETVYTSPLLNAANVLGGGAGDYNAGPALITADFHQLTGGTVLGRYIRITRTPTGGEGDHNGNVLALAEVQVFGSVPASTPPAITSQSQSQEGVIGGTVSFSVAVLGSEPLFYQWFKDGTNALAGQTNSILTLTGLAPSDAASYAVLVTNSAGRAASTPVGLKVFVWNAARAGTASQSSTAWGGVPERANDGNRSGDWANGSITHTQEPALDNEWWEVNLGGPRYIDQVHVWLRTGCCQERNENLRIVIYDTADLATRQVLWTQDVGPSPGSDKTFAVSPPVLGQVVRVEHPVGVSQILSLAEVEVFENPHGQNLFWVGGYPDDTWDTAITPNWDSGLGEPDLFHARDSVIFDDSTPLNSVTLTGTLVPMFVNVTADQDYLFAGSGALNGYSLVKVGNGTLALANSGPNAFASTRIEQGTLQIGYGGPEGSLPSGLMMNNATLAFNLSADLAVAQAIAGSGVVRKDGTNVLSLAAANTYRGGTVVNAGTLQAQHNHALGDPTVALTIVSNGATLDLGGAELWDYTQPILIHGAGTGSAVGALTKSVPGSGTGMELRSITLGSDASLGGVATARIDIGRGDWNMATTVAPIHINGQGHTLSVVGGLYLGILAGAENLAGVVVAEGASVAPHADNSFGAATVTLNGGTLTPWGPDHYFVNPLVLNSGSVDNQGYMQTYAGPVEVNGPVQVNAIAGGNITFNGNLSGAGSVTKIGGYTVFLGGDNSAFEGSYANDESNTFFATETAGSARAAWVLNGGSFANVQTNRPMIQLGSLSGHGGVLGNNLDASATGQATFVIGSNNASTTFAGQIIDTFSLAGTVALTKVGTGTLTLSGTNTYTGPTLIRSGTLEATTASSLGSVSARVEIGKGAVAKLSYSGSITVGELTFDGVPQAVGTWGATGSGAEHVDDLRFEGVGVLFVPPSLRIAAGGFVVAGGGTPLASLTFDTVTGFDYRVVFTDSLTPPVQWTEVPPGWQPGSDAPLSVTNDTSGAAQRFYQIERRP